MTADAVQVGDSDRQQYMLAVASKELVTLGAREFREDLCRARAAGNLDVDVVRALVLADLRDLAERSASDRQESWTGVMREPFRAFCDFHGIGERRHLLRALLDEVDYRNATWPRLTGRKRQPEPASLAELAAAVVAPRQPLRRALLEFESKGVVLYQRSRGAGSIITVLVYPWLVRLPPDQLDRVVDAIVERAQAGAGDPAGGPVDPTRARRTLEEETLPSEHGKANAEIPGRKSASEPSLFASEQAQGRVRTSADPAVERSDWPAAWGAS